MKRAAFLLCLGVMHVLTAYSQKMQMIYDINPADGSSSPNGLTIFNGKLYFAAYYANSGSEMWSYDGTTVKEHELNPNGWGMVIPGDYLQFPILGNRLYFSGNNGKSGLYSFDGINQPNLAPGFEGDSVFPNRVAITFDNRIFFAGNKANSGVELFLYDGANPPVMFDLNPGAGSSNPNSFKIYNGKLYFIANNWLNVFDPSTNSCSMLGDIYLSDQGSSRGGFIIMNNKMYFSAASADFGNELYSYDGNTITRLTDIMPGPTSSLGKDMVVFQGKIILSGADGQVYQYDPTNNSTKMVAYAFLASPTNYTVFQNTLYLVSNPIDSSVTGFRKDIWKYDGNKFSLVAGQKDVVFGYSPKELIVYNNALYFSGHTYQYGRELYRIADNTGVETPGFKGEVNVFPNPSNSDVTMQLTLSDEQDLGVSLFDIQGHEVFNSGAVRCRQGENNIILKMSQLPSGNYFYVVRDAINRNLTSGKVNKI